MSRTSSELHPGNPFRQLQANAHALMSHRSETHQYRWATGEEGGLGTLDIGLLASYTIVATRRSARAWRGLNLAMERWVFPEPEDIAPAQVARIDIARRGTEHRGRTVAVFMSPALDERTKQRTGIRMEVEHDDQAGPFSATVQLIEAEETLIAGESALPQILDRAVYGKPTLDALDGRDPDELRTPSVRIASRALVPLVVDCNRLLANLAAGPEAVNYVQMPIAPAPY